MIKNNKLMIVFILIIAFLLIMVNYTKATDNISELPTIITDPNVNATNNNEQTNNEQTNNEQSELNTINNTINSENKKTNANIENNDTLPQTGVQGDETLFIFISICIASAIYAYFKIRKYNNIH